MVRDPDLVQILDDLQARTGRIEANTVSRWGRIPHIAAEPATLADGMVWIRSDLNQLRYRSNGVTYTAGLNSGVILTDAAQTFTTSVAADITWGTEVSDPDNWWPAGGATGTVPAGLGRRYQLCYTGKWSADPGTIGAVVLVINGTNVIEAPATRTATFAFSQVINLLQTFAAGDTIKFQGVQNAGVNRDLVSRLEIA